MPGEILKRVEDSKVGRFVASIPTNGQGLLHLVEDVESGFVMAFPSLKGWELAAQDVIDGITKGVQDAEAQQPTPAPVAPPAPAPAPAPAPSAPTGDLVSTGVDQPAPANAAPSSINLGGTGLGE